MSVARLFTDEDIFDPYGDETEERALDAIARNTERCGPDEWERAFSPVVLHLGFLPTPPAGSPGPPSPGRILQ